MKPEPWEQHWLKLEAAAAAGRSLYHVAHDELGTSLSAFRRQDRERYAQCQETADEAREATANLRGEQWALDPEADPRMRLAYLKAESARYRRGDHTTGALEVTTPDLTASLERFAAAVAAARVRAVAGGGAGDAAGELVGGGEGRPRLAVAELAGEAESAGAGG